MLLLISLAFAEGPDEFSTRIDRALEQSLGMKINLKDMLGEGEGGWDNDPRRPSDTLNCITWLQWLLALTYDFDNPNSTLDAIRYYEAQPSFATRKHYIDRWLMLEPGPLRPLAQQCEGSKVHSIQLELDKLTTSRGFTCDLSHPFATRFEFSYLPTNAFLSCVPELKSPWYVVFPIAREVYYTDLYPAAGPMGHVHAMVLDNRELEAKLWHASIDFAKVLSEAPKDFASRMERLIIGFAVYELDPNWAPKAPSEMLPSTKAILQCEAGLKKK